MPEYRPHIVNIGSVPLGGEHPVRIQSMTNTDTLDIKATTEQVVRIINAGADYVRISVPGMKAVDSLEKIKQNISKAGYDTPLIADVHFSPKIAEAAATVVEKIRINPGNLYDKNENKKTYYTEPEYSEILHSVREPFISLINICKDHNTVMRIGVNHGSLSGRILNRYGNTTEGMAESAMEFLRICREQQFENIVVSMKASNAKTMVNACRLVVEKMIEENMSYPMHLGVTEAGEGEDGRIKSAAGIGTLLEEGIGNTIRVSLTEAPEKEIPFAKKLVEYFEKRKPAFSRLEYKSAVSTVKYDRTDTTEILNIGGNNKPVVITGISQQGKNDNKPDHWEKNSPSPDYFISDNIISPRLDYINSYCDEINTEKINEIKKQDKTVLILNIENSSNAGDVFSLIEKHDCKNPVILHIHCSESDRDKLIIKCAAEAGKLFIDGYGNGIWIMNRNFTPEELNFLSFGILQAAGVRLSKTEFISCPTCARTQFDVEKITKEIKEHAGGLPGIKIAVMGCIVNGPGEMADADYGYVGSGKDKVTLYKGQKIIKKNISSDIAIEEMLKLIKNG